jgi:hypothetical protein
MTPTKGPVATVTIRKATEPFGKPKYSDNPVSAVDPFGKRSPDVCQYNIMLRPLAVCTEASAAPAVLRKLCFTFTFSCGSTESVMN